MIIIEVYLKNISQDHIETVMLVVGNNINSNSSKINEYSDDDDENGSDS